jgi:hypothetical protein
MSILKTYSISVDVTGGVVDTTKLHHEIDDSGAITNFGGLKIEGDILTIVGDSFSSEATCDNIVQNHVPKGTSDEVKVWDYMDDVEDIYTPPMNEDMRVKVNVPGQGRLEYVKTLRKGDYGDYSAKVYYSDGATKSNAVIRRDFTYAYNHAVRQVIKDDIWGWYKKDNTVHEDTKLVKSWFEGTKYMKFMEQKRHEIILFLKYWVEQSMGYNVSNTGSPLHNWTFSQLDAEGKRFLKDYDAVISAFIDGANQDEAGSFKQNLIAETDFTWLNDPVVPTVPNGDLTETIKDLMLMELTVPMGPATGDPTDLSASSVVTTQVALSWTNNAASADRYVIEKSSDASNWEPVGTTWQLTSYTDTGLIAGETLYYRVKASNPLGDSGWATSGSVTVMT